MARHPNCPPRKHPNWAAAVVDRLDEVDGAWTDPHAAYAVISAFTGGGSAAAVVAELIKRGALKQPELKERQGPTRTEFMIARLAFRGLQNDPAAASKFLRDYGDVELRRDVMQACFPELTTN